MTDGEQWNGNNCLAIQQIETGLGLIQARKSNSGDAPSPALEVELIDVFLSLAIQVLSYAEKRSSACHEFLDSADQDDLEKMPAVFYSMSEASRYHKTMRRRVVCFLSAEWTDMKKPGRAFPVNLSAMMRDKHGYLFLSDHEKMMEIMRRWSEAFEPLWRQIKTKTVEIGELERQAAAVVLRLHIKGYFMALMSMIATDEMMYDTYHDDFAEMVHMAETLLQITSVLLKSRSVRTSNFWVDIGVILPLYFVGHKCREPIIRRRAISLLLNWPRREGVWDSIFAGRITEWAMTIEEKHMVQGFVPGWARIRGLRKKEDSFRRRATLEAQQRKSESSDEMATKQGVIHW